MTHQKFGMIKPPERGSEMFAKWFHERIPGDFPQESKGGLNFIPGELSWIDETEGSDERRFPGFRGHILAFSTPVGVFFHTSSENDNLPGHSHLPGCPCCRGWQGDEGFPQVMKKKMYKALCCSALVVFGGLASPKRRWHSQRQLFGEVFVFVFWTQ